MADTVDYTKDEHVAIISLNRPDSLNAFTPEMCVDLLAAFERAMYEDDVRAIVFTGEGRAFSAGADLKEGFDGRPTRSKLLFEYQPVMQAIAEIDKPVIAAVPGFVAGVGISFALYSDLLIMADDAFLLVPFTTIGLLPDGGANWLLVRQLGFHRAFQLALETDRLPAERCLELGLANRVVPAAELRETAVEWAKSLSALAPLSVAATKKVMRAATDNDWATCYMMEAELQGGLTDSEDFAEGVQAFLEKRAAKFRGK